MDFNLYFEDRADWVLGRILETRARSHADKPFLSAEGGFGPFTYAQVNATTNRVANGLTSLGVRKGDRVLIMMPNCLEYVYLWFALAKLGAVQVPVNNAYKGTYLEHIANNSTARIAIVDVSFLDRFVASKANLPHVERIVLRAGADPAPPMDSVPIDTVPFATLLDQSDAAPAVDVKYYDLAVVQYTSGTTGPSKGAMSTHCHQYVCAIVNVNNLRLRESDVYYTCQPLFHGNAQILTILPAMIVGAQAHVGTWFSASNWLRHIRESGATVTNLQGVMMDFVYKQPPTPDDRNHKLRALYSVPTSPQIAPGFKERFGIEQMSESYGQSEVGLLTFTPFGEFRPGSSGAVVPHFHEFKLVDPDTDEPVPDGEPGECVVRGKQPWVLFSGYYGMPEQTLNAFRNLWYHTGDMLRREKDGRYCFVDRTKDKIRRRAENISSSDVENTLITHPSINECAVIAVKSDVPAGEDEVKACIVLNEGRTLKPEDLLTWAEDRMPYFAVPRYVEYLDELPHTPTGKIQKQPLREAGVTEATWDREKAGYKLKDQIEKERRKVQRAAASG